MPSNIKTYFFKNNLQLIVFIFFIFALILKLFLLFQTTYPIFENRDIKLEFSDPENLQLEINRQKEIYYFSFENQIERKIKITNLPNYNFQIQREGEITEYKKIKNGIEMKIIPKYWGKTYIQIKKDIPYKNIIDAIFILSIILVSLIINKIKFKNAIFFICLIFSLIYISYYIIQKIDLIFQKIDIKKYEYLYNNSQYIKGQGSKEVIGDNIIYSYAGYLYANGMDPSQINFEHPPLAKIIIGFFYKIFQNFNIANLMFYILSLTAFYKISKIFFRQKLFQALSLVLFSVENSILNLIHLTSLDLPLLTFLLFSFLFFLKAKNSHKLKHYLFSSFLIGLAISSKIYFSGLIFLFCQFIFLLFNFRKDLKNFFLSLIIIPLPFLLSYFNYFANNNFIDFINYQKYIFSWFMGKPVSDAFGLIFQVLLFGKFKAWWDLELGKVVTIANYSIIWSIQTLMLLISIFLFAKTKKLNFPIIWSVLYLLFLSTGAMAENLLVIVLPFMSLNIIKTLSLLKQNKTIKIN